VNAEYGGFFAAVVDRKTGKTRTYTIERGTELNDALDALDAAGLSARSLCGGRVGTRHSRTGLGFPSRHAISRYSRTRQNGRVEAAIGRVGAAI
jgi:hypothetical protein